MSPGSDFETQRFLKPVAAGFLRKQLLKSGHTAERAQSSANTDCYEPIEKRLQIIRDIIKVLAEFQPRSES